MTQTKQQKVNSGKMLKKSAGWRQSNYAKWVLLALFVFLFYFSLAPYVVPETYNIAEGVPSDKDIRTPTTLRDEKATRAAEEEAANKIEDIYTTMALRNDVLVESILLRIEQLNADTQVSNEYKIDIFRTEIPKKYDEHIEAFIKSSENSNAYNELLLEQLSKIASEQKYAIPEETFYKLPSLSSDELSDMRIVAKDIVKKLTNEPLRSADTARAQVAELVNASTISNRTAREVVQELARYVIMPNRFYDKTATDEAKELARQNTQPIVYEANDVIVKKDQVITAELYQLLSDANLLHNTKHSLPKLGVAIMAALLGLFLFIYLSQSSSLTFKKTRYTNAQLLMLLLITSITIGIMHIVAFIQDETSTLAGYIAPVALGVMLITLLIDEFLALASTFIFMLLGAFILNTNPAQLFDFKFAIFIVIASLTAIYSIKHASQRSAILKAGIMVSIFGSLSALMIMFMTEQLESSHILYGVGLAFGSGLLTSVLVMGIMPFFEISFGILSALKLVELSSPNHPLLRKIMTETPGTYHHSVMVGNLAEAAAESIGADGLLCRVGAFYHDLGKTKRPIYFIENQNNMANPHDTIDPKLSKSIIVAHAKDGAEMLKAFNMPKPLRDIAEQHHGTTSLKYFYIKALKQAEEAGVEVDFTEDDFRYPGPKAQTKEAAIVGIADCVEAAVRSLRNPTVEAVENMIKKIIKNRVDDHQYNECDLTMKELDIIAQSLKEHLIGIFHSRIEYPDDVKAKVTANEKEQQ